jgi:hypothetical protein
MVIDDDSEWKIFFLLFFPFLLMIDDDSEKTNKTSKRIAFCRRNGCLTVPLGICPGRAIRPQAGVSRSGFGSD